jgi:hypothetical protein
MLPRPSLIRRRAPIGLAALVVLASGCGVTQISLAPQIPQPAKTVDGGPVAVKDRADGLPETIGYSTVSLFAIPAIPVRFGGSDVAERFMDEIRTSLRVAGYTPMNAAELPHGPLLSCTIDEFDFKNYTWLAPMIQTWGTIRLTLTLSQPAGAVRWQKQYEEQYSHGGVSASFNEAVNETLTKILSRATDDFTGADFRAACDDIGRPSMRGSD